MKRKKVKNSLLFKNIISNFIIIALLIASIVAVLYNLSAAKITSEIEEQIHLKLEAGKKDIQSTRESQEQQLKLLSRSRVADDLLEGMETEEFDKQVEILVSNYAPYMENVLLINSEGVVMYDSNKKELVGSNLSDRTYVQKSLTGITARSEIITSKATGHFVEVISVPLERDGTIIGVLATSMNIDYIKKILGEIQVETNGYAFLVDEKGSFIYHPKADLLNTNIADLGIPEITDAFVNHKNGEEGIVHYSFEGIKKMTMFLPIGDWSLSINAVESEYLEAVNTMLIQILEIGALMLLFASLITAYNSYLMVKKIKAVQSVMGDVTNGDLSVKVEEKNLKKCWETTQCGKEDCVGYQNDNLKCWELSGTLCKGEVQADAISKLNNCKNCKVYMRSEGDELSQMTRSLSVMITTIRNLIYRISEISQQLTCSSQELSTSSEETTVSAEGISERMEAMSSSAQNQTEYVEHINLMTHEMNLLLSDSAQKINEMANEAEQVNVKAKTGNEKVGHAISGMEEIKLQTAKIDEVMKQLIKESAEIGEINDMITSIADETNLLALNASIEAARAGENGRGFGVVADEIGKLAAQSQKSAHEISILIGRITESIGSVHQLVDAETEYVQTGILSVNESKSAFEEISEQVYQLVNGMQEVVTYVDKVKLSGGSVSEAVEKMSGIIEESGADMEEITASTQEQSSVSEEISASAMELAQMAERLLESISEFKTE